MAKSEIKTPANGTLIQCRAPMAKQVFVAGTFNNWDPRATPMEKSRDGTWRAHLDLPPGRYEYKFLADDCWCCELDQDETTMPDCVPNEFGTMNRVIEIP